MHRLVHPFFFAFIFLSAIVFYFFVMKKIIFFGNNLFVSKEMSYLCGVLLQ